MKKFITIFAIVTLAILVGTAVHAATTTNLYYTVTPNDLASGATFANGAGGVPFGYDHDQPKPIGSLQAGPSGFGDSCFWADVQGSAAGDGVDYTSIRLSPKDIFGVTDVTIGDLSEISYYTKWVSGLDWQIKIYTSPLAGQTSGWYGHRFNFERPVPTDGAWNQYDTISDLPVEWIRSGLGVSLYPTDTYLTGLHSTYGTEEIMFIDIISSYMTESPPGDSYLDGIFLSSSDLGYTATMDLAAVPIPGAVWLLGSGLFGLVGIRRKMRS